MRAKAEKMTTNNNQGKVPLEKFLWMVFSALAILIPLFYWVQKQVISTGKAHLCFGLFTPVYEFSNSPGDKLRLFYRKKELDEPMSIAYLLITNAGETVIKKADIADQDNVSHAILIQTKMHSPIVEAEIAHVSDDKYMKTSEKGDGLT